MNPLEILLLIWLIAGIVAFYAQKYTSSEFEKLHKKVDNRAGNFKKFREGMHKN